MWDVRKSVGLLLGVAALGAGGAFASTWSANAAQDDSSTSTKNCGSIVDVYGCLDGWDKLDNSDEYKADADIGAHWNGTQYHMAQEAQNSPAKENWVEHEWARDSLSGGPKDLVVWSTTSSNASGQANWYVPFEEFWWRPVCTVDQVAPTASAAADGGDFEPIPFDSLSSEYDTLGSTWLVNAGGTGVRYASAMGVDGNWEGQIELSDSPSGPDSVRVKFSAKTTTSASSDNATVANYKVWMYMDTGTGVIPR